MRSPRPQRACITLLVVCLIPAAAGSVRRAHADEQTPPPLPPCSGPEWRQFDFWLGDWEATWDKGRGVNRVTSILGRCAILEEFDATGPGGDGLKGMSLSTYDPHRRVWRQTWVDNSGAYLDFTGGLEKERMILSCQAERDGKRFLQRMVWSNIEAGSFDWRWERSNDGGKEWKTLWAIRYRRR